MSHEVANELIAQEVALLRLQRYEDLASKIGVSEPKELLGHDGNRYRLATVIIWDSGRGGNLRVTVGASGEGISVLRPATSSFIMTPAGARDEPIP